MVRDYRKCSPEVGSGVHSLHPITTKLHLKMSLENLVKDIPLIADDSWTYGDLMEVESRILKVLQPKLILDPTPRFDRLSDSGASWKLDFDLRGMRKKRLRQLSETVVTATNKLSCKRICVDRVPEASGYRMGEPGSVSGDVTLQHVHERTLAQDVISNDLLTSRPRNFMQEGLPSNLALQQSKLHVGVGAGTGVNSTSGCNPFVQDALSYNSNLNSTGLHGKMETQDGQLRELSSTNKRAMVGGDGAQQRSEYIDNLQQGPDMQWRNSLLQQQANARGIQYASNGGQRQSHLVREGIPGQDIATSVAMGQHGLRSSANGENNGMAFDISEVGRIKNDMSMLESEGMDRLQQRIQPNSLVRPGSMPGWNNLSQQVEKKEEQLQKRKTVQSPRVSAGSLSQSPLSARPTEMPGVSFNSYAAIPSASPPVLSQREKSGVTSMASIPRAQSVTSSANDTMQHQHQVQTTGKRRSNSLPKTPAMSGVGSPASVSNASIPMNAASPSVGTPQLADHIVLNKFSKIEMVTMRHQLNRRKTKVDELSRKPHMFFPQHVSACLSSLETNDNIEDDSVKSLSKSVVGGSANSYKIRVLSFVQAEHASQAPVIPRGRTRMIMSEKPNEGTIAMHYGDVDNDDYLRAEDYLPTLPNSHSADLLATQFQVLMIRDGYIMECDIIQSRPPNVASNSQPSAPATPSTNSAADMQQFSEAVSGQQQSEVKNPAMGANLAANSPVNALPSATMLPPGNQLAHQISQGLLASGLVPAGQQHLDSQALRQQQLPSQNQHSLVQQHPHIQRSVMMPPAPLSQLNTYGQNQSLQVGNNQMMGKPPTPLLQQQSHMQQSQMPRKMMVGGVGPAIGSGMVGLGGLNSVVGTGAGRTMGGTGIPASIGNMQGIGNLGQNSFAMSQAIHPGMFSTQQAHAILAQRLRMSRQAMLPGTQSLVGGMPGTRQIHHPGAPGLSILGNRGSMNTMQRTAMAAPKLMAGAGQPSQQQFSQQQQQQLLQQQQQQQQQMQQQQLQQQQQMPQQQFSQQQQQQFMQQQQQLMQQQQRLQPQQLQQPQEISPLQAALSPPQVSSPSTMVIPQALSQSLAQQASPHISSGAMHPMSGGNVDPGPASPQLSSQTLGSVGSVTNSSHDLQGVNKSNS
ncbi:PHYTOCHROME-DEPENDENT LATE-FLOWERING-like protein [Drosera capensis]